MGHDDTTAGGLAIKRMFCKLQLPTSKKKVLIELLAEPNLTTGWWPGLV
jgi:hypothetical protein